MARQDHRDTAPPPAPFESGSRKILWIGWDGADWEHITPLLEQGLLPNLERLINEGVMGNLATLQPVLSPMLWNSASTGKHAYKHGILGFTEPDFVNGGARPFSSHSRRCKAIWNILSQHGMKSNVVNWWGSHPAEHIDGCIVSNLIQGVKFEDGKPVVSEGTVHPADKSDFYAQFKVLPEELQAEQICAFVPQAHKIDQESDSRIQTLATTFAETLTTHAAATAVMEMEPWDFMAVYYTCIDHFAHGFMQYHPPRLPQVPEDDFEIFKDVVAGAYRFSDMMLGRVLEYCTEDTTVIVCSDHGFESGVNRPAGQPRDPTGPTVWHRDYGMIVMKGPNIRRDERIYGASLIDLTPTMLAMLGLPVGEDMDGRVLLDAFVNPPEIKTIPSWDETDGEFTDGMHAGEEAETAGDSEELLKQFAALGYIDDPSGSKDEQQAAADIESKFNGARSLMFARQYSDALPLLLEVVERATWETRFIIQLAHCYNKAGYLQQARRVYETAFDIDSASPSIVISWVELSLALGDDPAPLLDRLRTLKESIDHPSMLNRIGQVFALYREWGDAEAVYLKAVNRSPNNAFALQALSRIYCRQDRNDEAAEVAMEAVSLVHRLPHAHLNLGIAMSRLGEYDRAVVALKMALSFSPAFVPAHRTLSFVYSMYLDDKEAGERHRELAKEYWREQNVADSEHDERRDQLFDLPDLLTEAKRHEILLKKRPDQADPRKPSGREFVIVSGLPRSGTSLMMQMLDAGGLPPKTDGERAADEDNPRGYYEWEAIKGVGKKPAILDDDGLEAMAIKAVSPLIRDLPYSHRYKVIYLTREISEVVASQRKMIERRGTEGADQDADELMQNLVRHRNSIFEYMTTHPRIDYLEIDYHSLLDEPDSIVPLIVEFLGKERLPDPAAMPAVVDPTLYRQRREE